jgi:hypothetical protein
MIHMLLKDVDEMVSIEKSPKMLIGFRPAGTSNCNLP